MKPILLLTILALSINAFAQSNQLPFNLDRPSSSSQEIIHYNTGNTERQTNGINSEIISRQTIKHPSFEQKSLIQLFDSTYFWLWNIPNNGWKFKHKFIDIIYDVNNNMTSELRQEWNGSVWENNLKYTYTYDGNNNQTSELIQIWDGGIWMNYTQDTYTYDVNDNCTITLTQSWDGITWQNNTLGSATYDANNDRLSELYQTWNDSIWGNEYWYIFTFGVDQNLMNEQDYFWADSVWENERLVTYTYDDSSNLINVLDQYWADNIWWDLLLVTYTYDNNGNQILYLEQHWGGSFWENSWQSFYTYNGSNKLINELSQRWIYTGWLNMYNIDYTYDANNNLIRIFRQNWTNENTWARFSENLYAYDDNDFKINESSKHFGSNPTGIAYGDSTKYYFQIIVGNNEIPESLGKILIFPNPSSTYITFEIPPATITKNTTLSICNVNAQQMITRRLTEPQTVIDISLLPSGVYCARITNNRTVLVSKFIKQQPFH